MTKEDMKINFSACTEELKSERERVIVLQERVSELESCSTDCTSTFFIASSLALFFLLFTLLIGAIIWTASFWL